MSSEDSEDEEKTTGETEGDPDSVDDGGPTASTDDEPDQPPTSSDFEEDGDNESSEDSQTESPEPNPTAFEETESAVRDRSRESEPDPVETRDITATSEPAEHEHGTDDTQLASDEVYCTSCGEPIKAAAEVCPNCGVRQTGAGSEADSTPGEELAPAEQKEPILAGILSFIIPGAGQLYNGQVGRAIAAFLGVIIGDVILFTVGSLLLVILVGVVFFLLVPVIHVLVAYDAYNQAGKINRGEVVP